MKYKLSDIMLLIGGGTPKTSVSEYWNGNIPWLSVKDFNNDCRYVYSTEKYITQLGLENSSTKLLQKGDVIISARGTVGEIATIPFPMAFNQSCYGFSPCELPPGLLYFSILRAAQRAKSLSHGSVFDTITMKTFDHLFIPDFGESAEKMEHQIAPLLETVDSSIKENKTLVSMRDALLPQLMSGKIRVRDAEAVVENVL